MPARRNGFTPNEATVQVKHAPRQNNGRYHLDLGSERFESAVAQQASLQALLGHAVLIKG